MILALVATLLSLAAAISTWFVPPPYDWVMFGVTSVLCLVSVVLVNREKKREGM